MITPLVRLNSFVLLNYHDSSLISVPGISAVFCHQCSLEDKYVPMPNLGKQSIHLPSGFTSPELLIGYLILGRKHFFFAKMVMLIIHNHNIFV